MFEMGGSWVEVTPAMAWRDWSFTKFSVASPLSNVAVMWQFPICHWTRLIKQP